MMQTLSPYQCASCRYENPQDAVTCNLCGEMLVEPAPLPPPIVEQKNFSFDEIESERRENDRKLRRQKLARYRAHGLIGVLAFFVMGLASLCIRWGFDAFTPRALFGIMMVSLIMGFPVGAVISFLGGGVFRGAVVSTLALACCYLVFEARHWNADTDRALAVFWVALNAVIVGALPGGIIGSHVEADLQG